MIQSDDKLRVRSGPAMRVTEVDRQKFNECVANRTYLWLPRRRVVPFALSRRMISLPCSSSVSC